MLEIIRVDQATMDEEAILGAYRRLQGTYALLLLLLIIIEPSTQCRRRWMGWKNNE